LIVHSVLLKVADYLEAMNELNQSLSVSIGQSGHRLDVHMASMFESISRSQWKILIQGGHVQVNGKGCKPNYKIVENDLVEWLIPEEGSLEAQPENIPLDILFEDEAVLVLNKPAGLVVHPAVGNESGTLVNALLFHDSIFESVERGGIVHRLDKDTSGVMVVAKTEQSLIELQRQFKARETEKEYLALVWGHPPLTGRIETEIGRHPKHRQKMAILTEGGRKAISTYEVAEQFAETALLEVKIETGRTHQIRVHMLHLGHSIVGDSVYGRSRKNKLPIAANRQMLHAARLEFTHPTAGKRLSFDAPLPNDMRFLLEGLRNT
jgi:23S rRNA pseudouridine1911/1915/1917 synthase